MIRGATDTYFRTSLADWEAMECEYGREEVLSTLQHYAIRVIRRYHWLTIDQSQFPANV